LIDGKMEHNLQNASVLELWTVNQALTIHYVQKFHLLIY